MSDEGEPTPLNPLHNLMPPDALTAELLGRWGESKALLKLDSGEVLEVPFAEFFETDELNLPQAGVRLCVYLNEAGEIARWEFADQQLAS